MCWFALEFPFSCLLVQFPVTMKTRANPAEMTGTNLKIQFTKLLSHGYANDEQTLNCQESYIYIY